MINHLEQWYNVKKQQLVENGGRGLVSKYEFCWHRALEVVFPNFSWKPWLFPNVSRGYWRIEKNRLEFAHWLEKKLGIERKEQWYMVRWRDVVDCGGGGLLRCYDHSVQRTLIEIFPDYNWDPWKFHNRSRGFWNDSQNLQKLLGILSRQLNINATKEWLYIGDPSKYRALNTRNAFRSNGGWLSVLIFLSHHYKDMHLGLPLSLKKALDGNFPSIPSSKAQCFLFKMISNLFPDEKLLINFRHSSLVFQRTQKRMELDLYMPYLSLAIEYLGEQHYRWSAQFGSPKNIQERDLEKEQCCHKNGITLITVPYWWDGNVDLLAATIRTHRIDLLDTLEDSFAFQCNLNESGQISSHLQSRFGTAASGNIYLLPTPLKIDSFG